MQPSVAAAAGQALADSAYPAETPGLEPISHNAGLRCNISPETHLGMFLIPGLYSEHTATVVQARRLNRQPEIEQRLFTHEIAWREICFALHTTATQQAPLPIKAKPEYEGKTRHRKPWWRCDACSATAKPPCIKKRRAMPCVLSLSAWRHPDARRVAG